MRRMSMILAVIFFCAIDAKSQTRLITHVADPNGLFDTQIMLINGGNESVSYELDAYDASGDVIATTKGMLAPQHTSFRSIVDLFGTDRVSHFVINPESSDLSGVPENELTVFASYQLKVGGSPAQVKETLTQAKRWQFFPGDGKEVTDGFAVVNLGVTPARMTLQRVVFDGPSDEPLVIFEALPPHGKGRYIIDNAWLVPGADQAFVLESDQVVSVMALRFKNPDNRFFWEIPAEPLAIAPDEDPTNPRSLTVLYTSDEHGWMEATDTHGGAAGLMGLWRDREGFADGRPFVALSGGDMWTGPAISTWTKGEAMVEVMNAMEYTAAALGNHEFDFGLDLLRTRAAEAQFPFLAANLTWAGTGAYPDFVSPYLIQRINGIDVGVIGLITTGTPSITFESITGSFDFLDYEVVLRDIVPEMRENGADMIVLISHVCGYNLQQLMPVASELGIDLVTGGHCHDLRMEDHAGVPLLEVGSALEYYGKISFSYDIDQRDATVIDTEIAENVGGTPDAEVTAIVDTWAAETDEILGEVIGFASQPIDRRSNEMENMIVDAWLIAFPNADIAMSNTGGIRQSIPQGEITVATILGVLPFENFLMDMQLSGSQIIDNILCCYPILGGMTAVDGYYLSSGALLDENATYRVLTTDFLYEGGSGFLFQDQDPDAYPTGISWRQPVIDWIRSLNTSASNPLNQYLDSTPRY